MWPKIAKIWFVPLAASALFFWMLLEKIPYARGYGWGKEPIGDLVWAMWGLPDWGHGMFVPFIALGLIYLQKDKLSRAPVEGSRLGAAVFFLGVFIYCLGLKAESHYIGFFAVQILLAGVVLWFWGRRVFSLLSFTWMFLCFSWPMPFLDAMVALPLRLIMSRTAHQVLDFLGTANVQSGTAILSAPNFAAGLDTGARFQIDIADPCSGMHSLFALMMMSALAGYISLDRVAFRWLLFFSAIPLAIAGNVVRILFLVWGTEHFGSAVLGTEEKPSWFHMGCGYAVYIVALGLLFALINLFSSKWMNDLGREYLKWPFAKDDSMEKPAGHLPSGGLA